MSEPIPPTNKIRNSAAIKPTLIPQPLEDALGCVTLFAGTSFVLGKPLVDLIRERIQLRPPDRRHPPIPRPLRIGRHLRNTVPADTEIPGNLAPAQAILEVSPTHLQIQVHGEYPQPLPKSERAKVADFYAARDTTAAPLPWPSIAPPFTIIGGVTDFANFAADRATKNLTAFAEITRKAQTEAVELLVAAGKEASNEAAAAVQKAANDATKAAKKAAAA